MGIKNLNKVLKKYNKNGIKKINISSLKNKTIGIDTSIYLYKFTYLGNMIESFLEQIKHLLENKITPVYLFDGKPTEDKKELIKQRKERLKNNEEIIKKLKEKGEKLREEINNDEITEDMSKLLIEIDEKIDKKTKNTIRINYEDVKKFKEILKNLGIFYYECNGETDIYVKSFFDKKLIDYVMTEDLDFLTHGCNKVLYNYKYNSNNMYLYDLELILNDLEIEYESFIDMCIILGCDYHMKGIKGIGPVNSYKYIKKYKRIKNIVENEKKIILEEDFNYENILKMFKHEIEININEKDIKISKNKINKDYFENTKLSINDIIKLIENFKYIINILTFLKK
jgi:flap endonuclease-1